MKNSLTDTRSRSDIYDEEKFQNGLDGNLKMDDVRLGRLVMVTQSLPSNPLDGRGCSNYPDDDNLITREEGNLYFVGTIDKESETFTLHGGGSTDPGGFRRYNQKGLTLKFRLGTVPGTPEFGKWSRLVKDSNGTEVVAHRRLVVGGEWSETEEQFLGGTVRHLPEQWTLDLVIRTPENFGWFEFCVDDDDFNFTYWNGFVDGLGVGRDQTLDHLKRGLDGSVKTVRNSLVMRNSDLVSD